MPRRISIAACVILALPALAQSAPTAPLGTVDNPMHIGNGVKPPQILHTAEPNVKITDDEKRNIGDIFLGFIVDQQGIPRKLHVLRCTHQDLCQSALEALRQYRFRPATYEARAVAVELSMNVNIDAF